MRLTQREYRTLRSEANGPLPLSRHRSTAVYEKCQNHNHRVRKSENDFGNYTVGCLRYSRFAPRSRPAVGFNCGIRDPLSIAVLLDFRAS
jgi:hypothetical protein